MATQPAIQEDAPLIIEAPDEGQAPERDYEAEARVQGWRPKEEFKGDEARWTDAETFVKRGEEIMPFVKKENAHLKRELADMKRTLKKVIASEQNAHANAIAELEARQEAAAETGDLAEHRRIRDEIKPRQKEMRDDTPGSADLVRRGRDASDAWREANPWYDRGLKVAAASEVEQSAALYADRLVERHSDKTDPKSPDFMEPEDFFQFIGEQVVEKYPTVLSKAHRTKPISDVAGVTRGGIPRNARTGANLPPEFKSAAERYMRLKIGSFAKCTTKAEAHDLFAKDHEWDDSK